MPARLVGATQLFFSRPLRCALKSKCDFHSYRRFYCSDAAKKERLSTL